MLLAQKKLLVKHAELSKAEHAAESTPSSARTTQAASYKSAITNECSGGPTWRQRGVTYFAAMSSLL